MFHTNCHCSESGQCSHDSRTEASIANSGHGIAGIRERGSITSLTKPQPGAVTVEWVTYHNAGAEVHGVETTQVGARAGESWSRKWWGK